MADIKVKGRYRVLTYDGTTPFDFTSYSNQLCSIRTPNPVTFVTISQYIPGGGQSFTSFQPGSSYTIVTKSNTAEFTIGDYVRSDRLPSSVNMRFPNFYYGLDRNSIVVPLSNYALSINNPLSTVFTYIPDQNGFSNFIASFNTERYKEGLSDNLTHLQPGSSYQFRNRVNYTLFAPLQSEMGNWYVCGNNVYGSYGMGHQFTFLIPPYSNTNVNYTFSAERIFGNWVKIVESNGSVFALSAYGNKNKLFVCGRNDYGQLGLGYTSPLSTPVTVFRNVPGNYLDIAPGLHSLVVNDSNQLLSCGLNTYGQLGLGDSGLNTNRSTFTLVPTFISNPVEINPSSIFNGYYHSLVRDQNGNLWSCGLNSSGQLGLGDTNQRNSFTLVGNIGYQDIGASLNSSAYISNNRMYACGANIDSTSFSTQGFRIGVSNEEANSFFTTFTQEICGFSDIQSLWMGGQGIFVRRSSSNVLWACGGNFRGILAMRTGNYRPETHYVYRDIRALQPTIISSDIIKLNPFTVRDQSKTAISTSTTSKYPYWIDGNSRLKTLVINFSNFNSVLPYEIDTGVIASNINDYKGIGTFLFNDRTVVTPTPTKTSTPTPTPTPSPTPESIFPQTNGATIVHYLGRSAGSTYNRRVRVFYSTNFDNWTYDTQFTNSAFHGIIYDPGSTTGYVPPQRQFLYGAGCIPTGAAYTNSTRTLYHVQGYVSSTVNDFRICKSDNTAGNGTYNTFNISTTFTHTGEYLSDCFYFSLRNLMYVVYCPTYVNPDYGVYGFYAYSYNTITNQVVNGPYKIIDNIQSQNNRYNSFPSIGFNNNDMLQKSPNGDVYISYVEQPTTLNTYKIKTYVFNRNSYTTNDLYFNEIPSYVPPIPAHAPSGSPNNLPMVMRYAKINSNTFALAYMYARRRSSGDLGPLANIYINFYNNGSWSSQILIAEKIPFNGGTTNLMANGQLLPFAGWSTGYDMYFHPLEKTLHILYITDTQSTDNKAQNDTSSNCKVRLMKLNSSGTILSDTLVFDAGAGSLVVNGYVKGAAEFINYFYKSTNQNEFIPYFSVMTHNGSTSTHRIFKYINGTYSQVYSVPWDPMGAASGPNGCQVKVITT